VEQPPSSVHGFRKRRRPVAQSEETLDLSDDPPRWESERVPPRLGGGVEAEDERVAGYVVCRSAGKRMTSRIVSRPVSTIASLSMPTPQPPFGGMPYDIAST
jgi:hypothetical protein